MAQGYCVKCKVTPESGVKFIPLTVELIRQKGGEDILVIGGGIIPKKDVPKLKETGIAQIFGQGTPLDGISKFIQTNLGEKGNDRED